MFYIALIREVFRNTKSGAAVLNETMIQVGSKSGRVMLYISPDDNIWQRPEFLPVVLGRAAVRGDNGA